MPQKNANPLQYLLYKLGLWYCGYRFVVSMALFALFLIAQQHQFNHYAHPQLYFYTLVMLSLLNFSQFLGLKWLSGHLTVQLASLFVVDVVYLSLLSFSVGSPNVQLSLLFVITVFSATILLQHKMALLITLLAVIAIVYQHFVTSLLDVEKIDGIGNSMLLIFLFFVVYGIGKLAVQRFQILENLTENQSVELHQLQNINRYILEQSVDGYLVLNSKLQIVLSNPAACQLLGIHPLLAQQQLTIASLQPDLYELLRQGKIKDGESFRFASKHSKYHVQIKVQQLIMPKQALTLLILKDSQQLSQQVQQLKLAALGQLSASIAHEIRNPLAAIVQANELAKDSDPQQQQLMLKMIAKQAQRIDGIVRETLNMARNETSQPVSIDLFEFFDNLLSEDLGDIKTKIQLELPDHLNVYFDPNQLAQVIINLARNAIRHNSPDFPYIMIRVQAKTKWVLIDVIDFGDGVAKRDISQLFKPFFSTEIKGTGLGLYLSHTFCEANDAKLSYVEQLQGACFRIECARVL